MRLAAHQPDLFPWPGFWWKMAHCDMFDLAVYDQFQKSGYQRRVMMRDKWCSIPIAGGQALTSIYDVKVAPGAREHLTNTVVGRYRGSRYWERERDWLLNAILDSEDERLWRFNAGLIRHVKYRLGIDTPIRIARPPTKAGIDGLIELCGFYGATAYLSGTGGQEYMGDDPEAAFASAGVDLRWSRHEFVTSDSVLSLLMDHEDPISMIIG